MVLVMGFSFVEAFVLPQIATATPAFVDGWMKMFNGGTSSISMGALPTLWTLSGPLYILGGLLFGIATFRAGILPRGAAVLLALGTVLAPVAAPLSLSAQPKIAIPTGLALAWLGYALMTERRTSAEARNDASSQSNRMSIATMPSHRRISLAAGIAYVLTFVSIPTLALVQLGQGCELRPRLGIGHRCHRRWSPRDHRRARRHRHRRHPVPDPQEAERDVRARPRGGSHP